ncbi:MAG: hypothetical protein C4582_08335 [Desulfobacteraceae bacterium]|jgi:hypothetical protein|nr:MAG: hypothetical protein C4582_08335 [Desulfobacteraceae bacterium]
MISKKKEFYSGVGLMAAFIVVLIIFFSPVFNGKNGLDYLDNLYNSISKGSAYYIPDAKEKSMKFKGKAISASFAMDNAEQASKTALLFTAAGAKVDVKDKSLKVSGDLGAILMACLEDADAMYANKGELLAKKYGYDERQIMYNWWKAFRGMGTDFKDNKLFKEADALGLVVKKAVETAYNYYKIEPQKIGDRIWVVIFSLLFYVIYTVWYGYAIMFMFEGWGLKIGH